MVKKCTEEEREKLYALWEIEIIMNRQFSLYYLPSTDNIDITSTPTTQTKYRKTKKKRLSSFSLLLHFVAEKP